MTIEGSSSAELRDQCMRKRFAPIATEMFARMPEVKCIAYTIGQYWCDEAEDAVHESIVTFLEREPTWPTDFDAEADQARQDAAFAEGHYDFSRRWPCLDENSTAIAAFASFCAEFADQDMPIQESHVVYAWARRDVGGDVKIEVVGTMLRPEWEDRFDVGFAGESEIDAEHGGNPPRPAVPAPLPSRPSARTTPKPEPRGLWAFLRRLFGG